MRVAVTPGVRTAAAWFVGYVSGAVPMLLAYLGTLDSIADIDPLKILVGALAALIPAGATGTAYRVPAPNPQPDAALPDEPATPVAAPGRWRFSARSRRNLAECHADLQRLALRMLELSPVDFVVIDGQRTVEEQSGHVESGASKTMNSRHLQNPSHAFDFLPLGGADLEDPATYEPIVTAGKRAAAELGIAATWGHDWGWDSGHVELDRGVYPDIELT